MPGSPGLAAAQAASLAAQRSKAATAKANAAYKANLYSVGNISGPSSVVSNPTAASKTSTKGDPDVAAIQHFLNNKGFKLAVDGVRGPQTNAAITYWHVHHSAPLGNTSDNSNKRPGGSTAPSTTTSADTPASDTSVPTLDPTTKAILQTLKNQQAAYKAARPQTLDPNAFATSSANAKYDAEISALQNQITNVQPQTDQHQQQITDWFKSALDQITAGNTDYQNQLAQTMGNESGAASNFLGALGGSANPANAGIAAQELVNQKNSGDLGLSSLGFGDALKSAEALQAAQAHTNEQTKATNLSHDLTSQLLSQKKEKGDYFNTTLGAAQQQDYTNKMDFRKYKADLNTGIQNTLLGIGTLSVNQQKAALANQVAQNKSDYNSKQMDYLDAKIKNLNKKTDATSSGLSWSKLTDRKAIEGAISGTISGANGGFKLNPGAAWNSVLNILKREGLDNANWQKLASGIFEQVLRTSHQHGQWLNTYINKNGTVVVGPPRKKK